MTWRHGIGQRTPFAGRGGPWAAGGCGRYGVYERRAGGREDTKFMSVELADVRERSL